MLQDALVKHGKPEIFNTDQGSQFTGADFTGVLTDNGIAISMDGKGAWGGGVSEGLRHRLRGTHIDRPISRLLQSCITTPIWLCG
jgi:transposase InsO family protein